MRDEQVTYTKSDILTGLAGTGVITAILLFLTNI
ncbi:DUF3948 family protein [Jeotgalibacillus sp. R-1-5s-1]|nr:DUF3948 family protein [Jeotgalibacillus sp. R-1-5s-1]TFD97565.1 DUF3948 family protein [Jeotgalibacillus sp. R-1-5s-1]